MIPIHALSSLLFLFVSHVQSFAQSPLQLWIQHYHQTTFAARWDVTADYGYRWMPESSSQHIGRIDFGYHFGDSFRVSTGIAHLGSYESYKIRSSEIRPFQSISTENLLGNITLSHRIRIEERIYHYQDDGENANADLFEVRARYSLGTSFSLFRWSENASLDLGVSDEVFFNVVSAEESRFFDQNRFFITPTVVCNDQLSVAFAWCNQLSPGPNNLSSEYLFWLQIKSKIDL